MTGVQIAWAVAAGAFALWIVAALVTGKTVYLSWFVPSKMVSRREDALGYWMMLVFLGAIEVVLVQAALGLA